LPGTGINQPDHSPIKWPGGPFLLNDKPADGVYVPAMTKLIALVTAGMFAAGMLFAGEHAECTKQAANSDKPACSVSLASLNLTTDQQKKMDALMAEHHKEGCSAASEKKYMQQAKTILTKEQYAKFKAECSAKSEKSQT
jgi:hypothetical protein